MVDMKRTVDPSANYRKTNYSFLVKSAAWLASSVALLLLIAKLVTWWLTGSVSMLASLVDSSLDLFGSLCSLAILHFALLPADEDHLFGHGKAESLAALAQAMLITGSGVFLLLNGIERFRTPQSLISPEYGIWVSLGATLLTGALITYQKWVIKRTQSQAIAADSLHYQTDFFMNISIVVALLLSWIGWTQSDAVFAIAISFYILYSAVHLGCNAVQSLLDHQLPIDEQRLFLSIILKNKKVKGCHDFRTRQSGATKFLQFHIELDDELSLLEAHIIADEVETALHEQFERLDVIIHIDPISVVPIEKRQEIQSLQSIILAELTEQSLR